MAPTSGGYAPVASRTRSAQTRPAACREPAAVAPSTGVRSYTRTPSLARRAPQAERQRSRVGERQSGALPDRAQVGRRSDLRPHGVAVEHLGLPAVAAQERPPLRARPSRAAASPPTACLSCHAASIRYRARSAFSSSRFARPVLERLELGGEAGGSVGQAVGERSVDEPPLRPLAPQPAVEASSTTTSRPGRSSLAITAAHSPVKPAPTIARSASTDPSRSSLQAAAGRARTLPARRREAHGPSLWKPSPRWTSSRSRRWSSGRC